jgi:hypothetical protein
MDRHGAYHVKMATRGGHPAMAVAIEVQFRRAQQGSARESGVMGLCVVLRHFLVFLFALLSDAFLV